MAHNASELKSKPNTNTLAYLARYQHWDKLREKLDKPEESAAIHPHSSYNFTRETVLHYVAKYGQADICKRLIELGANVNSKDWKDQTPLHKLAAFGGGDALATARVLLEAGANRNALDTDGATPSSFASKSNQPLLLELLTTWGGGLEEGLSEPLEQSDFSSPFSFSNQSQSSDKQQANIEHTIPFDLNAPNVLEDSEQSVEPPSKKPRKEAPAKDNKDAAQQIKLKCDSKLKMVKVLRTTGLFGLYGIIQKKFNLENQSFTLCYQDSEGDTINLDDDDDLEIFLDSTDAKKMIFVKLKPASEIKSE